MKLLITQFFKINLRDSKCFKVYLKQTMNFLFLRSLFKTSILTQTWAVSKCGNLIYLVQNPRTEYLYVTTTTMYVTTTTKVTLVV
jgi:hypothetical protein